MSANKQHVRDIAFLHIVCLLFRLEKFPQCSARGATESREWWLRAALCPLPSGAGLLKNSIVLWMTSPGQKEALTSNYYVGAAAFLPLWLNIWMFSMNSNLLWKEMDWGSKNVRFAVELSYKLRGLATLHKKWVLRCREASKAIPYNLHTGLILMF